MLVYSILDSIDSIFNMKLKLITTLGIIIFMFYQDLRNNYWLSSRATFINQSHASLQIPLVRHSGDFTDWLTFVTAVTYLYFLLFHIFFVHIDQTNCCHAIKFCLLIVRFLLDFQVHRIKQKSSSKIILFEYIENS